MNSKLFLIMIFNIIVHDGYNLTQTLIDTTIYLRICTAGFEF